ncbi:MAG: glycosyltransferase family 4 protein [Syntrophomonadaceae bacterium]|jgi:glycosyltransferase involved in cell wall biosynthesis
MKKICHLTSVHPKTDTRILYKECKTLVDAGYDVTLIVQNDKDEVIDGVKIIGIEIPKNRKERMTRTVHRVYQQALECNADIYHFHDPELIPISLKLKRKGEKIIYDVHEDVPRQILSKQWIPAPLRKIISWMIERIENYAVKRFDYIVTATPYIRDRFLKINRKSIDVNNFPLLSELHIPNTDWSSKEKLVCYVGGIGRVRGIQEMVQAIGMTSYSMLLAGKFESSAEREITSQKDGWRQVMELGYINRKEVKEVLSRSMAGLVLFHPEPNHINAQPNKMFEYMSAGIPVIASNFPLWKEIIEGNKCGICVDPLNIIAIADAINWIMDNPEQAKQMGENGRKAVEDKYNWEKEGNKLLKIYEELLQ